MKKNNKLQTLLTIFVFLFLPQIVFAQMSAKQSAAFEGANVGGSSFAGSDSIHLFAGIACVLVILWFVWVVQSSYEQWASGQAKEGAAGSNVLRALFVMIITLVIVTY